MNIPLSKPDITELECKNVLDVLTSGQLSFGKYLVEFENQFKEYLNVKYAVAMNSGTSALHVAVKAIGLKPGDEVITSPYSFIASSNCLLFEGVKPIFVDVDADSMVLDTSKIENAITEKTKAILVVHIFGQSCDMDKIMEIANKYDLKIIEDACESLGSEWNGQKAGTFGDVSVFAFYPNKQITTGEGGMLVTNDMEIFEEAMSLRNQGRSLKNEWLTHERLGFNYRLSDIHAAVGVAQMKRLNEILSRREKAASYYKNLITEAKLKQVKCLEPTKLSKISWFVFPILFREKRVRDYVMHHLNSMRIQAKPYFPSIHLQPLYKNLFFFKKGSFLNSEKLSDCSLAIPFYTTISKQEQEHVITEIKRLLEEYRCGI
ncbi:polysaccharide biosynthesis protein [Bacillus cereus]|nr:polysaccharide biosynthesis protein [Bacillus cereus]